MLFGTSSYGSKSLGGSKRPTVFSYISALFSSSARDGIKKKVTTTITARFSTPKANYKTSTINVSFNTSTPNQLTKRYKTCGGTSVILTNNVVVLKVKKKVVTTINSLFNVSNFNLHAKIILQAIRIAVTTSTRVISLINIKRVITIADAVFYDANKLSVKKRVMTNINSQLFAEAKQTRKLHYPIHISSSFNTNTPNEIVKKKVTTTINAALITNSVHLLNQLIALTIINSHTQTSTVDLHKKDLVRVLVNSIIRTKDTVNLLVTFREVLLLQNAITLEKKFIVRILD